MSEAHLPDRAVQRLDKWLWSARFFKTRALAARTISEGRVRIGGEPCAKAHRAVGAGDVVTFAQGERVRVVRILSVAARRGPAPEAQGLYEDLTPADGPAASRAGGGPRPTGRDRREIDRLQGGAEG